RSRLLGGRRGLGLRLRAADRLDLDLRQARPEAGVLLVAALRLVLADPDLRALDVIDDAHGDRRLRVEIALREQHVGREGLSRLGLQAVDEQPLAETDAVLLATDFDDCVRAHKRAKGGPGRPARRESVANSRSRRATRTWARTRPACARRQPAPPRPAPAPRARERAARAPPRVETRRSGSRRRPRRPR